MSESEWHGWARRGDNVALHIGELPGRKSVCLYEIDGSVIRTLAFFKDVDKARRALQLLDRLVTR